MKALYGNELVKSVRHLADNTQSRLWIVVPYIGGKNAVKRILGKKWYSNSKVSFKLLTDTSDAGNIDTNTFKLLYSRGEVKTIKGLHAKIYIFDDICIVTSANLTNTAFAKRHEIGLLLNNDESKNVFKVFNKWWAKAEEARSSDIERLLTTNRSSNEEILNYLPSLWEMPDNPGDYDGIEKKFFQYDENAEKFKEFSELYASTQQRVWSKEQLYFEIDGLLNYLYHYAALTPSKKYTSIPFRKLNNQKRISELKRWGEKYKLWNKTLNEPDIEFRKRNSKILSSFFSPEKIMKLNKDDLKEAFKCLNTFTSYPLNRTKLLNNNDLKDILNGIQELVYGEGNLAARMGYCNKIKYIGASSMNEILAYLYPNKYPLINNNTIAGMKFFGYDLKVY
jgi:hypothetical protein